MAIYSKHKDTEILILTNKEAACVIAMLAAQLAGNSNLGGAIQSGACPEIFISNSSRRIILSMEP